MPAADVLQADLHRLRYDPITRTTKTPAVGIWFTEADKGTEYGDKFCGICGTKDDRLVNDHCHTTGLLRGLLCFSCNNFEGRKDTPTFDAWRLTAPLLQVGQRDFYRSRPEGLAHSTWDELLTLPMEELFARADAEYIRQREANAPAEEAAMAYLVSVLCGDIADEPVPAPVQVSPPPAESVRSTPLTAAPQSKPRRGCVMSTEEAVRYLNGRPATTGTRRRIGPARLRKLAADNAVPAHRNGTEWLFTDVALDEWLKSGMADWSQRGAA